MKLVRDKIPNIIRESGNKFETKTIESKWEHLAWLKIKIDEESQEFLQDPCVEEGCTTLFSQAAAIRIISFEEFR